nr:hypothetical protein [Tanacetum cinerariifolium]
IIVSWISDFSIAIELSPKVCGFCLCSCGLFMQTKNSTLDDDKGQNRATLLKGNKASNESLALPALLWLFVSRNPIEY